MNAIAGCFFTRSDELGHYWRKLPSAGEETFFKQALRGAVSPEEHAAPGDFVGWFGVLLKATRFGSDVRFDLDHRYADDLNVYYGVPDSAAITTVSLFGGGRFNAHLTGSVDPDNYCAGDLVRVYGNIERSALGESVVRAVFIRHWPRVAYELAPLRPVRDANGQIARRDGWPRLDMDTSVETTATPIDDELREALLTRFKESSPAERLRIAFTLGELGGPDVVLALQEAMEREPDPQQASAYASRIRRAERKEGPIWNPKLPYPYWATIQSRP